MTQHTSEGFDALVYQVKLPISNHTLIKVADLIRAHRTAIGSRWRKADPALQALLVLAVLRHDMRLADIAAANGISASTLRRWVLEVIGLLAARAPRLDRALRRHAKTGQAVVLVDGTLVPTTRPGGAANRRNYSGKHRRHGRNVQAITSLDGTLLWISRALPGAHNDVIAARACGIAPALHHARLGGLADKGYDGVDNDTLHPTVLIPTKARRNRPLTPHQHQANSIINAVRAPVERAFAALKTWRICTKIRLHPRHITTLLRALLVLTQWEHQAT